MGLDIVELILKTEEAFDLEIPEEDASTLETPRKLADYLEGHLLLVAGGPCLTQRAFYRLRSALVSTMGSGRRELSPSSSLDHVLPIDTRRESWAVLQAEASLSLPELRRSHLLVATGAGLSLATGGAVSSAAGPWIGVLTSLLLLFSFFAATRHLRRHSDEETLGGLASFVATRQAQALLPAGQGWSRSQIQEVILTLVREATLLEDVPLDVHFVHNLGLD